MERQNDDFKVGRIARSTERALGLSLTGEVSIYIPNDELDGLTERMPNGYLRFLREVTEILKNPDFVSFDENKEEFVYHKQYFKGGFFQAMYLFVGRGSIPGKWYFKRCIKGAKLPLPKVLEGRDFRRPVAKKVEKEEEPA